MNNIPGMLDALIVDRLGDDRRRAMELAGVGERLAVTDVCIVVARVEEIDTGKITYVASMIDPGMADSDEDEETPGLIYTGEGEGYPLEGTGASVSEALAELNDLCKLPRKN